MISRCSSHQNYNALSKYIAGISCHQLSSICRVFQLILSLMDSTRLEKSGSSKLTRRMTIDEEDSVEFEYELNDLREPVVLGKGSFGTVYSAIDLITKKKMAVKEIPERTEG